MSGMLNGLSFIAVGAYLSGVVYRQNIQKLGEELQNEIGFLEFYAAALALYWLASSKSLPVPVRSVAALGIFSAFMLAAQRNEFPSILGDYGAGRITLTDAIGKIFEGNGLRGSI